MISAEKMTTLPSDEDDDLTDFIVNWINALNTAAENKAVKMQGENLLLSLNIQNIL